MKHKGSATASLNSCELSLPAQLRSQHLDTARAAAHEEQTPGYHPTDGVTRKLAGASTKFSRLPAPFTRAFFGQEYTA